MHRSLQIDMTKCGGDKSLFNDLKIELEKSGKFEVIRDTLIFTIRVLKEGEELKKDALTDYTIEKKLSEFEKNQKFKKGGVRKNGTRTDSTNAS